MDQTNNKGAVLSALRNADPVYFIASGCTKQPYVHCHEETLDDEIFLFLSEDKAKEAAKKLLASGNLVHVVRVEKEQMLTFYTGLYTMGINALVLSQEKEEASGTVQLFELVTRGDMSRLPEGKVWVENPSLHLTALYFMQQVRMMKEPHLTPQLRDMQEEILADFAKGTYIVPVMEENKVPLIRQKDGTVYQPVFTDILEFNRFNREGKMRSAVVPYEKLVSLLPKEAIGAIVNPATVSLQIPMRRRDD